MKDERINQLKDEILKYLAGDGANGVTIDAIKKNLKLEEIPTQELQKYLDEIYIKGFLLIQKISNNRILYKLKDNGRDFVNRGGYSHPSFAPMKSLDKPTNKPVKKLLFISFESSNSDKVRHIKKELANHSLFEPLIVEDRRRANKALSELVKEWISSSYCFIPILSPESIKTQWVNQEIGYAVGVKKLIKPIVETGILKELKGFVHSQNQCPYTYTYRIVPYKSSENKSFMSCFKLLIKDLEEEARGFPEENSSQKPTMVRTIYYHKPIGTYCKTGETCPEGGVWVTDFEPIQVMTIPKGTKMPPVQGHSVKWKLSEYRDNLNIIPNR